MKREGNSSSSAEDAGHRRPPSVKFSRWKVRKVLRRRKICGIIDGPAGLLSPSSIGTQNMQRYRSGHNGADSKSVWEQSHEGSNPSRCASSPQASYRLRRAFSFHCKAHHALILLLPASKPNPLRGGCAPRRACGYSAQFPSVGPHCPDMQDFTVFLHAQGGISWESVPAGKFHLLNRFLDFRVVFACFCLAQFIFIRFYLNKNFPADPCFL